MKDTKEIIITKVLIGSALQFICFVIALFWMIKVLGHPESFGAPLNVNDPLLPAYVQAERVWTLFFGTLFVFTTIYLFYKSFQIENKAMKIYFQSTLSICMIGNLIFAIKEFFSMKIQNFWKEQFKVKNDIVYMMSFRDFCKNFFSFRTRKKKIMWMNILAYILFAFCFTALVFNFIKYDSDPSDIYELKNYYIFSKWTYFTQLTNTACLIYLVFFFVFRETNIVKNNNFKILMISHIVVVSSIYILILLPGSFLINDDETFKWEGFVSSLNQHVIIPFLFTTFFLLVMKREKIVSINFIYTVKKGILYPLWYAIYVYLTSFVCRYSPYFVLTNMNPNMIIYNTEDASGNYLNSLIFIPIILWFIMWFFIFWNINMKFCGLKFKIMMKKHFWFAN